MPDDAYYRVFEIWRCGGRCVCLCAGRINFWRQPRVTADKRCCVFFCWWGFLQLHEINLFSRSAFDDQWNHLDHFIFTSIFFFLWSSSGFCAPHSGFLRIIIENRVFALTGNRSESYLTPSWAYSGMADVQPGCDVNWTSEILQIFWVIYREAFELSFTVSKWQDFYLQKNNRLRQDLSSDQFAGHYLLPMVLFHLGQQLLSPIALH